MSNRSDPSAILDALDRATDAFEEIGGGRPNYEDGIHSDGDWGTQLTKACKLLEVADVIEAQNGHYTAVIELCFGATERSIESYAVAMAGDSIEDFRDHEYSYQRAHEVGLFERETAEAMRTLYSENRTESYYGGEPAYGPTGGSHDGPRSRSPRLRSRSDSEGRRLSVRMNE